MLDREVTLWGIRAGVKGEADSLFLKEGVVALGWFELGDLTLLNQDRETYKAKLKSTYPNDRPGSIPVNAGQLFRFVNEIKVGDLVAYPSKIDRLIHIGEVESNYEYKPALKPDFPNIRKVKWLKSIPRTSLTQGALYEIGSALSFFQVKNYAEEYIAALKGRVTPVTPKEDSTVSIVFEAIVQNTRDYIFKQLAQEVKGHPFEHFVAHLLNAMGYRTIVSPEGTDGGIDILAYEDELGFRPPIIKVQVKSTQGSIGDPTVSSLYGKVSPGEFGLFVTLGTFTNQARSFAKSKSNLRLIDGNDLVNLILEHYHQFDSRYQSLIPLKQVYIPESQDNIVS